MIEKLPFTEIHTGREDMVDLVEYRPVAPYEMQHKINELVDIINALVEENNIHERQIDKLQMKAEDRMIGCTTLDIPKSYKQKTDLADKYGHDLAEAIEDCGDLFKPVHKAVEFANIKLQHKLEVAIDALDCIVNGNCHMRNTAKRALDQIKRIDNE